MAFIKKVGIRENRLDEKRLDEMRLDEKRLDEKRLDEKRLDEKRLDPGGGVLDLNLYGDVPTKKIFFTLFQNFCLQMIPCSRKNR